jgi:quercetin dioxygenase-like cupin family protein
MVVSLPSEHSPGSRYGGALPHTPLIVGFVAALSLVRFLAAHADTQAILCKDSPVAGVRPANFECALLVRKRIATLPAAPVYLFETFASPIAAQRAETPAGAVVRAGGKIWLVSLARKGERTPGATFVAEIGPLEVPRAASYEMVVGEVVTAPGRHSRVHTHPGPEAWYLLSGEQCVEMPGKVMRAQARQTMLALANTPMELNVTGTRRRDAIFAVVRDATKAWSAGADWRPPGHCRS